MPRFTRRKALQAMCGAASLTLAGCPSYEQEETIPVGSLGFANEHSLPHTIGMHVTGMRAEGGESMTTPDDGYSSSSMVSLQPGEAHLFPSVLTDDYSEYELAFTIDGEPPQPETAATTMFTPSEPDDKYLGLVVYQSGDFTWEKLSLTTNQSRYKGD